MTTLNRKKRAQSVLLALAFILGLGGTSQAAEYWLRADAFPKTMPDGAVITMWGFANCTANFASCAPATVPGPELNVPVGDTTLTVHLRNNLTGPYTEPISLIIPGQQTALAPVKTDTDTSGRLRVTSFVAATPVDNGASTDYVWNNIKAGTYLYQSGTHPALQVQMGLYGAVTHDAAASQAYGATTAYTGSATILFSEIDPLLHISVASNDFGPGMGMTSTMRYEPKYFLINGEPYSAATATPLTLGYSGSTKLLRLLNAGLRMRVPTLNGLYLKLVAEDGNLYPFAKDQYSVMLAPGKTIDALVTPATHGTFAVFDRRLGLTNYLQSPGGMLAYLQVVQDVPTGSVAINGGAATTNVRNATLTLSATSALSTVTNMRFSWDNATWYAWESYATIRNVTIPAGDGTKTIYVQFRDAVGTTSAVYSDSIVLDQAAPTGSVVINSGAATTTSRAATLTLSATDATSTVTNMRFSWDNVTWYGWEAYSTTRGVTIPAGDGTKTIYVQFRDAAGNISTPYSDSIVLDQAAPTGSVVINGGALTTNSRAATLTLSATDATSTVTNMRFSWDNVTWYGWEAYATTRNVTIPSATPGTYTIYIQFRDAAGNVSTAFSDSIDYVP